MNINRITHQIKRKIQFRFHLQMNRVFFAGKLDVHFIDKAQ